MIAGSTLVTVTMQWTVPYLQIPATRVCTHVRHYTWIFGCWQHTYLWLTAGSHMPRHRSMQLPLERVRRCFELYYGGVPRLVLEQPSRQDDASMDDFELKSALSTTSIEQVGDCINCLNCEHIV